MGMIVPPGFFPEMPAQVLEMWLEPIASEYGWPFQSTESPLDGTKWRYVLSGTTLQKLAQLRWNLERMDLTAQPFRPGSFAAVQGLIQQHALGIQTLYANILNSQERFRACASFIRENRDLPAPIVVMDTGSGFDLLDGNHRLAALLSEGFPPSFKVPVWIGR